MKAVDIPKRTGVFAARRVSEQGTKTETTGLTYGLEELPVTELYALIDISNQMLEDAAFDMQAEITNESSEQFAVKEGAEFVSGTGVGQPEGILTNADVGFTVSGTAATIADANGVADGIIALKHAVKSAYARNANWVLNRTTLGSVRTLKDSNKRYIWMPGIQNAAPNTIDGDPYVEMPDMPSEGAGAFPMAYGDFRRAYTWVDRITMEMLRDPYTQATSGNIRFIVRKRSGGQVVLGEAIRKLKCST
jgi:HK97 family phage major capsid protein